MMDFEGEKFERSVCTSVSGNGRFKCCIASFPKQISIKIIIANYNVRCRASMRFSAAPVKRPFCNGYYCTEQTLIVIIHVIKKFIIRFAPATTSCHPLKRIGITLPAPFSCILARLLCAIIISF